MATYTPEELSGQGTPTEALTAGTEYIFTLLSPNILLGSAYFTFETVRNANGFYDPTSPTNAVGTLASASGVQNPIQSPYIFSEVINSITSSFTFTPTADVAVGSSYLRTTGGVSLDINPSIPPFDPDAQAYITAAGIISETEIAAVGQLFSDLKGTGSTTNNSNIYSKFYALYPISPTSLAAASVNAVNPSTYDITWFNSPTHAANGVTGNGTNMYGSTNFIPSASGASENNFGITLDIATSSGGGVDFGSNSYIHLAMVNPTYTYILGSLGDSVSGTAYALGVRTMVRRSANDMEAYLNGSTEGSKNNLGNWSFNSDPLYIFCRNNGTNPAFFSNRRYRFCAIHEGLTSNEAKDLSDSINTYNAALSRAPFQMTVDTTKTGTSSNTSMTIPFASGTFTDCVVDWGDGTTTTVTTSGNVTHDYGTTNTAAVIQISGAFPGLYFNNGGDKLKLTTVDRWGSNVFTTMVNSFYGCANFTGGFTDAPNLGTITSLPNTFNGCSSLNVDMNNWDVSNMTNLGATFFNCSSFNGNITSWDVSNVTFFVSLFFNASSFNQPLDSWNMASATETRYMFYGCSSFNQNLNSWDVSNSTTFERMFFGCTNFDGNISSWTPTSALNMSVMFYNCTNFNSNIGAWDVSSVTSMNSMFTNASAFDQDLGSWNVSNVTDFVNFMGNKTPSTFSATNLDAIYNGWDSRAVQTPITINFGTAKYTAASSTARASLVGKGWAITDGGI